MSTERGPHNRGGWVMQGWGGSHRGWVGHAGKGWVMKGWGGSCWGGWDGVGMGWACMWGVVGHAGVGSGGSYRGGMRWVMKNIKILKILNYWCYRVSNPVN